jgi:1-acyl-sn-glycerol-3-phosphate acyltransferase
MKIAYFILGCIAHVGMHIIYPFRVYGNKELPEGPLMICANHSHWADPVYIAVAFGPRQHISFMAKAEILKVPVGGPVLRSAGVFPVTRGELDAQAIRTTIQRLKDGGRIMLFPEGTRVKGGDPVAAKAGAVKLAIKQKIQILPIYISTGKRMFHRAKLVIGTPLSYEAPKDRDYARLADELMKEIYSLADDKVASQ